MFFVNNRYRPYQYKEKPKTNKVNQKIYHEAYDYKHYELQPRGCGTKRLYEGLNKTHNKE